MEEVPPLPGRPPNSMEPAARSPRLPPVAAAAEAATGSARLEDRVQNAKLQRLAPNG